MRASSSDWGLTVVVDFLARLARIRVAVGLDLLCGGRVAIWTAAVPRVDGSRPQAALVARDALRS